MIQRLFQTVLRRTALQSRPFATTMLYTKKHEWLLYDDEKQTGKIGITQYAQDKLGDIVHVELPYVGDNFDLGEVMSEMESVKAASAVYCPVKGMVTSVNEILKEDPSLVNSSPEADAWIAELSVEAKIDGLLLEEPYRKFCEEEEAEH